jgi:tryptophan 2,3-dioxygenase
MVSKPFASLVSVPLKTPICGYQETLMGSSQVNYSDYLQLDPLLSLQRPLSVEAGQPAHDEPLFIVVHQCHELWFKHIHHELDSVMDMLSERPGIDERKMGTCLARISRVTQIFHNLVEHLRILETMAPLDFMEFRDLLVPASGFQSLQFRCLELKLGSLTKMRICPVGGGGESFYLAALRPQDAEVLKAAADKTSLHDLVVSWLERSPFLSKNGYTFWSAYQKAVAKRFEDDANAIQSSAFYDSSLKKQQMSELHKNQLHFEALFDAKKHEDLVAEGLRRMSLPATHAALFIQLYRDEPLLHLPYRFLNQLIELDESLQNWRAEHSNMVHRMIGAKVGTGGSMGYPYLKTTLGTTRVFSDLLHIPTFLIPRSHLPPLPEDLRKRLSFFVE